jgi:hypothetical protein
MFGDRLWRHANLVCYLKLANGRLVFGDFHENLEARGLPLAPQDGIERILISLYQTAPVIFLSG